MKRLYQALDRIEAQLLVDRLKAVGIESVVLGDYLSGAVGELPATVYPEVWLIDDADAYRAEDLLQDFTTRAERKGDNRPWRCANCGEWVDAEFDVCWNCATPRRRDP